MNDNQMILSYFNDLKKRAEKSHIKHLALGELFTQIDSIELRDKILEMQQNELENYITISNEINRVSRQYSKVVYPCPF